MIIRSLYHGMLDLSSQSSDNISGQPLRLIMLYGQTANIDDRYSQVIAIKNAIDNGLITIVSYGTSSTDYVMRGALGVTGSVVGTTDTQSLENKTINSPLIVGYREKLNNLGSVSGNVEVDISLGSVVALTVANNVTFSFADSLNTGESYSMTMVITNGGAHTINWPLSVKWPEGTEPALTSSGTDILTFLSIDAGTTWHSVAAIINSL